MTSSLPAENEHEDESLPDVSNLEDDLSLDNSSGEDTHENDAKVAQSDSGDEPEGVFALFDSEFRRREEKMPLNPEEKTKFGEEFLLGFDEMFDSVEGGEDIPLFSANNLPSNSARGNSKPARSSSSSFNPGSDDEEENEEPLYEPGVLEFSDNLSAIDLDSESAENNEYEEDADEDALPGVENYDVESDVDEASDNYFQENPLSLGNEEDFEESFSGDNPPPNEWDDIGENLEEINFDEDDEDLDELPDDSEINEDELFDEFAKLALGEDEDLDDDEEEDEDDFTIADIAEDSEIDSFEEVSIMSSEEVAEYSPNFSSDDLKFQDEDLPDYEDENDDPFAMPDSKKKKQSDAEDEEIELDPFGEEAQSLQKQSESSQSKNDSDDANANSNNEDAGANSESNGNGGKSRFRLPSLRGMSKLISLILFPWTIYSKLTTFAFGLLNSALRTVSVIPIIGKPFGFVANILSAIPMIAKKAILLAVIIGLASGASLALPKPSSTISLPDSGGAKFSGVQLKDGIVSGTIKNRGDIILSVYPSVAVSERKLLDIGSWFKPDLIGECTGDLASIAIDDSVDVSFKCDLKTDTFSKIKPSLKD